MSEAIKWAELTPQQRDTLVAEKIMGWRATPCDGEQGEQPISSDGWFCLKCGYDGNWGDSFEHMELPPRYTTRLDAIKQLRQRMAERFPLLNLHLIAFTYHRCYAAFAEEYPYENWEWAEGNGEHCMEEAICKAALKVCKWKVQP